MEDYGENCLRSDKRVKMDGGERDLSSRERDDGEEERDPPLSVPVPSRHGRSYLCDGWPVPLNAGERIR